MEQHQHKRYQPRLYLSRPRHGGQRRHLHPPAVNTSAVAFRPLTTTFGADGTTVYLSFLAQATNSGSRFLGLSLFSGSPGTTGTEQLFVGKLNGFGTFGITSGSGSANTSAPSATLSLLVARIDFVTGPDTVTLYVNPTVGAPEPAASTTLTGFSIGTFDYLRLAAGAGNSTGATSTVTGTLDELRIGNTFASVTPAAAPEPSQFAAFAVGIFGLGALTLRAKRRTA